MDRRDGSPRLVAEINRRDVTTSRLDRAAGALGCEWLKVLALMGVGCHVDGTDGHGQIHVTDMDTIERSNLNRQFLFRPADVGHAKSERAARAISAFNQQIHVRHYQQRVGADDAGAFGASFWNDLDGVINALDNVPARQYVDSCCVRHGLPLLESGTTGTKGNTQVPRLTYRTYISSERGLPELLHVPSLPAGPDLNPSSAVPPANYSRIHSRMGPSPGGTTATYRILLLER